MSQLGKVRVRRTCRLAGRHPARMRQVLRAARELQASGHVPDAENIPDEQTGTAGQELLAAERDAVLREAVTRLPPCRQRLIAMLTEDPLVPYAQISATLRIPVGSIGPSRVRCLDKLRRDPAIAAVINPTPHPRQASSPGRQLR